jgi:hypothetical protein
MVLDHLLSSVQPQSFEWTRKSFEQWVTEFYTILHEGTSSSCFRDVGGGNLYVSSLQNWFSYVQMWLVLVREDAEVHLRALQAMIKQFQLLFRNVWIMGCTLLSNLPMYSLAVI